MKKKIYHVYLDRNVTAADLHQIAEGITLEDGDIRADAVEYASETDRKQVGIEIHIRQESYCSPYLCSPWLQRHQARPRILCRSDQEKT